MAEARLTFRPLREADVSLFVRWLTDPRVTVWWEGVTRPFDEARVRAEFFRDDRTRRAVVELDGTPVGYQQWYRAAAEPEVLAELGLTADDGAWGIDQFIGDADRHGQGIGTRQVRAIVAWVREVEGARRVFTDPVVENARAIRCYEKAGFRKVRVLPEHERLDGQPRDSWLMEHRD